MPGRRSSPRGSGHEEDSGRLHDLMDGIQKKIMALKTVTRPSLVDEQRLRHPLAQMFRARRFTDLQLPFAAVGVDLHSGDRVLFREGDLLDAIYASSAIPGVFPPFERGDQLIVDGGAPYRVPVEPCRELGADVVVGVDIPSFEPSRGRYRTGLEMILRCDAIARQRLDEMVIRTADVIVSPQVGEFHWSDFRRADECRNRGYEAAMAAMPRLRELIAERGGLLDRIRGLFGSRAS